MEILHVLEIKNILKHLTCTALVLGNQMKIIFLFNRVNIT